MKWTKPLRRTLLRIRAGALLAAGLAILPGAASAQKPKVEELLQRHDFVFIAEWATGNQVPRQFLTPTNDLRITSDSVDGRLPFYGRVYSPSEAYTTAVEGFIFRSRLTSYDLRKKRKGNWQLVIEAPSGNNVQKLTFDISENGSARLFVNSAWRDAMFYDGRIEAAQTP